MKQIRPYLTFNGNCREAMYFYKACLGGELHLQSVGDSPLSYQMPDKMRNSILHAELKNDSVVLLGSDICKDTGLIKGNSVAMSLDCSSEKETHILYNKLASGGNASHPLQETYWGALFGSLTDKYGHDWLINHKR